MAGWSVVNPDTSAWRPVAKSAPATTAPVSDIATSRNAGYGNLSADWQGAKNAINQTPVGILSLIRHPIDTAESAVRSIANPYDPEGLAEKLISPIVQNGIDELGEARNAAKQGSYGAAISHGIQAIPIVGQAMKSAGEDMNVSPLDSSGNRPNTYGSNLKNLISSPKSMGTLAGASTMLALPALEGVDAAVPDRTPIAPIAAPLRTAAIGDPDAAALRGLRVPASGKKVLPMQDSLQTARPYLQGADSLEDLQGRIKPAKQDIYKPIADTLDAVGDNPVQGPDGPTTMNALEAERLQLSAMNRGLKTGDPAALQLAQQKGLSQADALARQKAVEDALDPALSQYGIDPKAIRQAYGAVSRIGNQISGRSTLLEKPQAYGFGKLANPFELAKGVELTKPATYVKPLGNILDAGKDIAAGRYWNGSPTDVGIREGFANAGPKPDLGQYTPFKPTGLLDAPPIELGAPPEVGGTPAGYRPPNYYHDTDAMRLGRLLPAPPIELGGRIAETMPPPFRYDTTAMRMGRTLPAGVSDDMPLSSLSDIFDEQIPQATRIRPKTIEGKK